MEKMERLPMLSPNQIDHSGSRARLQTQSTAKEQEYSNSQKISAKGKSPMATQIHVNQHSVELKPGQKVSAIQK